jgi:Uncharacterised nucleotidyltransferase
MERLDQATLWAAVDAVADELLDQGLDDAVRLAALRSHRLHLLVTGRARVRGVEVPPVLQRARQLAGLTASAVPRVLARARAASDGPLMLMKGAEVAAVYPDPLARPYVDVDLLTPDAPAVQRSLLAAGFQPLVAAPSVDAHHHLAPLHLPGLPVRVEVHRRPNWLSELRVPAVAELFEAAQPSVLDVPGLLAPAPEHHAVLLAVHAWADRPLGRLGRLVDVEAVSLAADAATLEAVARAWGCTRLWRSTRRTAQGVLLRRRVPGSLMLWTRRLPEMRERTVFDAHLERWLAPVWAFPARRALGCVASAMARDIRPHPGEGWGEQAARVRRAVAHAHRLESEHLAALPRGLGWAAPETEESR